MSASGRNDFTCKICKKNFEHCPHSYNDLANRDRDDNIRKIVRKEFAKLMKELAK